MNLYYHVRNLIGNPGVRETSDRQLDPFLRSAFDWLCVELDARVVTADNPIDLSAGTYRYPLPEDFLLMLWVEWNERRLVEGSLREWVRDGVDWRNQDNGEPAVYAIEGRELYLKPPPSSTAITTSGTLDLSYIGASDGIIGESMPGMSTADLWVGVYAAARDWLGANPGSTPEEMAAHAARRQNCEAQLAVRLPAAKARHADAIQPQYQRIKVWSSRTGRR